MFFEIDFSINDLNVYWLLKQNLKKIKKIIFKHDSQKKKNYSKNFIFLFLKKNFVFVCDNKNKKNSYCEIDQKIFKTKTKKPF